MSADPVTQWLVEEALSVSVEHADAQAAEREAALAEAHRKVQQELAGR